MEFNALKQERLDAERLHHIEGGRPGKDSEAAVLGGDEGHGVALILDELGGGQVAGAAELRWMDHLHFGALDQFGGGDLVDSLGAFATGDFGSEGEQFMVTGYDGGAVDSGEASDDFDVRDALRGYLIWHRLNNGSAPVVVGDGDD